jgi:hypothetical protein
MVSAMDKSTQSLAEFGSGVCVTFIFPLFFLLADYVLRAKTSRTSFHKLVLQSGPDCCILSFGAMGSVFVDPSVQSIPSLTSPIAVIAMVLVILILRFCCLDASAKGASHQSVGLGLGSVFGLLMIPTYAFLYRRYL